VILIRVLGGLLIVLGIVLRKRAERRVFARWHALRPREWAAAMRPARRAFPFSAFVAARIAQRFWMAGADLEWLATDREARKQLWIARRSTGLVPLGIATIALSFVEI
jgi:hypothetical protein